MKVRPLKLVFCRNQGRAPQWSRWKLEGEDKPVVVPRPEPAEEPGTETETETETETD